MKEMPFKAQAGSAVTERKNLFVQIDVGKNINLVAPVS